MQSKSHDIYSPLTRRLAPIYGGLQQRSLSVPTHARGKIEELGVCSWVHRESAAPRRLTAVRHTQKVSTSSQASCSPRLMNEDTGAYRSLLRFFFFNRGC